MAYRWTLTNLTTLDFEVLTNDPIGWNEAVYTIQRSEKYKGIMHEYTSPLKFHCDGGGKAFIDAAYETLAIDARVDILIEYDCDGSGTYDMLFNGIINFATYMVENDLTICQVERSDLISKFISRDEISVDLETVLSIGEVAITAPEPLQTPMQAFVISYADTWRVQDGFTFSYNKPVEVTGPFLIPQSQFDLILDRSDIDSAQSTSAAQGNVGTGTGLTSLVKFNDNSIVFPIDINFEIHFKGELDIVKNSGTRTTTLQIIFNLRYGADLLSSNQYNLLTSSGLTGDSINLPFDINITDTIQIQAGDSLWLQWVINDTFGIETDNTFTFEASTFEISSDTVSADTTCKTVLIHEAFNQVVDAIADSDGNFVSNFYGRTDSEKQTYDVDGCGSLIAVTNGLNLREFEEKKIYTSFSELFNAMDCIHNLGAGYVNGKIQVEPLEYWFDNLTKIISLPFVNRYTIKDDNRAYINKIEIGYSRWETEFRGGIDEVNAKQEYSTVIKSVKGAYSKLCDFIAGTYPIEFTRRKNKTLVPTEDWRYDNNNFLIAATKRQTVLARFVSDFLGYRILVAYSIKGILPGDTITITGSGSGNDGTYTVIVATESPSLTRIEVVEAVTGSGYELVGINGLDFYYPEKYADSFSGGTGMLQINSAYNLRLTPKRMLLAHLNVITAGLQKIQGLISFVKGEGNTDLETAKIDVGFAEDYDGQSLAENQDIDWTDGKAKNIRPLWLPQIYSFEYPLTYTQFKTIKANPNGYIEFYRFEDSKMAGYLMNMEYSLKTGMTKFELLRIYAPEGLGDEFGNYIGDGVGGIIGGG